MAAIVIMLAELVRDVRSGERFGGTQERWNKKEERDQREEKTAGEAEGDKRDVRGGRQKEQKTRERERERTSKAEAGGKKAQRSCDAVADEEKEEGKMEQKRNQPVMSARIRRQTRRDLHSADR